MLGRLHLLIYKCIPKKAHGRLGSYSFLKPFRDLFFRSGGTYREVSGTVHRNYLDYQVVFQFFASIQVVRKASERGMENTLLRNSIALLKRYKPRVKNDYYVFDIGTNFGYLSLVWAKTIGQEGKVVSFEPHPKMFKSFSKSVMANSLEKVSIPENLAMGAREEIIEINLANTTANVLDIENMKKAGAKKAKVQMTTLDLYFELKGINRCDLIKIDVDGIEMDILKGGLKTINKYRPIVIAEMNLDSKILDFFEELNYIILDMELKEYKEVNPLPGNAFFVPNEIYV